LGRRSGWPAAAGPRASSSASRRRARYRERAVRDDVIGSTCGPNELTSGGWQDDRVNCHQLKIVPPPSIFSRAAVRSPACPPHFHVNTYWQFFAPPSFKGSTKVVHSFEHGISVAFAILSPTVVLKNETWHSASFRTTTF
jgi:hypothetical protein